MSVPSRYRESIQQSCGGSLIVTVDIGDIGCLLIYPLPEWERIEQHLTQLPSREKQVRRVQRLLLGHATECEIDGQFRVLLPPPLRQFAGLNKHTVLVGLGNKFELWDRDKWLKMRESWVQEENQSDSITASLEKLLI